MSIKLENPAEQFDEKSENARKMLVHLQSNILKPHGRNFTRHIFLQFTSGPAAKTWLRNEVVPLVRTADEQFNAPADEVDGGTVVGCFLSAAGYEALEFSTDGFASDAFKAGMKSRRDSFFGPLIGVKNKDPEPEAWHGWSQNEIHALVTIADDDGNKAEAQAKKLEASAAKASAIVLHKQEGNVLRRTVPGKEPNDGDPVEHFGYRDGISQPVFTRGDLAKRKQGVDPRWDASAPLSLVLVDDPLSDAPNAFGSYLVYRKLEQDLARFDKNVLALADSLAVDPDLAGAYAVGRFKDGTPVVQSNTDGVGVKNDFDFRNDDEDGFRCPMHAHIRKANPRGTTPFTSLASEKRRRIARRAVPYGPPIGPHVAEFPKSNPDPKLERGLLFMCFQANIEEQFEFIQRTWIDNVIFPRGILFLKDTGDDPVIGQDPDEPQRWPKKWDNGGAGTKAFNFDGAVTLRGGEYFFAPSIPFLKSL